MGETSSRCTGSREHLGGQDVLDVMSAWPSSALGWSAALRLFFTATAAMSRLSKP